MILKSARLSLLAALLLPCVAHAAKPLKVFIMVGQSNMEGHVAVRTFENLSLEPKDDVLLKAMMDGGKPAEADNVFISYATGKEPGEPIQGKLSVGYGAQGKEPKIGPEYTFGLFMEDYLDEPILIIKAAWGGKSLHTDFRPPSAGPSEFGDEKKTGYYYRWMMDHVKSVLADPGKAHPAYDKEAGYEIAGFVWFQGWNDMVASSVYPQRTKPGGYDDYSETLAHFIRDVRKDLSAPKMPFVIGVMGVDGISTPETELARSPRYRGITPGFRAAMEKPASMPEFKGNVIAVKTAPFWDVKLAELRKREVTAGKNFKELAKGKKLGKEEAEELKQEEILKLMSEEELHYLRTGRSNSEFHYNGSPRIMGHIGKAFADALAQWHKENG